MFLRIFSFSCFCSFSNENVIAELVQSIRSASDLLGLSDQSESDGRGRGKWAGRRSRTRCRSKAAEQLRSDNLWSFGRDEPI